MHKPQSIVVENKITLRVLMRYLERLMAAASYRGNVRLNNASTTPYMNGINDRLVITQSQAILMSANPK